MLRWNGRGGRPQRTSAPFSVGGAGNYDADWAARSAAAGVVYANALDTLAKIDAGYTNGSNGRRVTHDTAIKVLSSGSMRFDLLAGETGDDLSGNWVPGGSASGNWGHTFGQNSDMYVQYRCRLSSSMYTNLATHWKDSVGNSIWPGWKVSVLYAANPGTPCANIEVTVTAGNDDGDRVYTHCGARHARTQEMSPNHKQTVPYLRQSGWDLASGPSWANEVNAYSNLEYNSATPNQKFPVGEWFTMYQKVHVGTWGAANSTIELWIQLASENFWRKLIAVNNYQLDHDGNANSGFGRIMLTPYMTGLVTSAPTNAYMWFSELIASTQPIALPLAA